MAEIETSTGIDQVHGKLKGGDAGYFYVRNGKQFYRDRDETYQTHQSPRQKWNSAAFAYAHRELHNIESNPKLKKQMENECESANHVASNGKTYSTAHAWKFNSLLQEYKQAHPFVQQ